MSNEIAISGEFTVTRTSKAGKATSRGVLGVVMSGNATERKALGAAIVEALVANNNYRGLMREVLRVFPASVMKKARGAFVQDGRVYLEMVSPEGKAAFELLDTGNPNKATAHAYARAVLGAVDAPKAKGEKAAFLAVLDKMLRDEKARLEVEAEQLHLETSDVE